MSRHIVRFSYGAFLRVLRDKRALVISDNGKKSLSEERRMGYLLSYHTDTGRVKNVNQDALLLQSGCFKGEQIVLAVLCDGMGGLEKGEAASAAVIRRFAGWFRKELPVMLKKGLDRLENSVLSAWTGILEQEDEAIGIYGRRHGVLMGTTATAMLFAGGVYYIAHVGDGRVYELDASGDWIWQLTKDQTLAEREVEQGRLTKQEAESDSRRNVLLQSIGAGSCMGGRPVPSFMRGPVRRGRVYLLCSDGFRHEISEEELLQAFHPSAMAGESDMKRACIRLTELDKARGENDNISVLAVKAV